MKLIANSVIGATVDMLEHIEPFPGYSSDQDFVLRLLCYAEREAVDEMRLSSDGHTLKMDYLIKGEWKHTGAPPQRLWGFIVQGAISLLRFPDALSNNCEGMIQSDVLKATWLFHSSDVNRELCFKRYHEPKANDSSA
jgi:hypothetical protein